MGRVLIFALMLFKNIIGHTLVKERLINAVNNNRISHAQLFAGPAGSGSLALAMAYTQYINCENKLPDDSCGKCLSCLKMAKLVHPDVHFTFPYAGPDKPKSTDFIMQWREAFLENPYLEIHQWYEYLSIENKQGTITVNEAADLLRKLSLKSFESPYKTSIIWLPEKMRTETSNKLLKILEEPPDKTLFILVTEHVEQLLPTILSRTQLIKTGKLTDQEISLDLMENQGLSAEEARRITQLCDGNYNMALQMAGETFQDSHSEKNFVEWMRICFQPFHAYPALLDKMDKFAKLGREEQKNYLVFSLETIRECMLMNNQVPNLLRFGEKGFEHLQKFSLMVHNNNVLLFEEELNKACFHIERNANAKILFMDLSFKMHKILTTKKPEPQLA